MSADSYDSKRRQIIIGKRDSLLLQMGKVSGRGGNEDSMRSSFRVYQRLRGIECRILSSSPVHKLTNGINNGITDDVVSVGDLNVACTDCCIGRGLAAIHSKNNHQSFVLYTMFSLKKQLDVFNVECTVLGSINSQHSLKEMPLLIPTSDKT